MTAPSQKLSPANLRPGQVIRERGIMTATVDRVWRERGFRDGVVNVLTVEGRCLLIHEARRISVG